MANSSSPAVMCLLTQVAASLANRLSAQFCAASESCPDCQEQCDNLAGLAQAIQQLNATMANKGNPEGQPAEPVKHPLPSQKK